ncbi:MAG: ABC transporter permease [bacterium]|nr:ABC transporter permease [bacterium]
MAKRKCGVIRTMKQQLKKSIAQEMFFLASLPALLWQLLFLCVPLLIIIYLSFVKEGVITGEHYRSLFQITHMRVILRSLGLAFANALICLICAYPVAYFLGLYAKRWKNFLLFLLVLPFWTNFLVQVYAWFFLLERNGFINSLLLRIGIISQPLSLSSNLFAVFLVMVYCYIPFMILPIYSNIGKLNYRLLEASADLGATPWQTFKRITLPLSIPGIKTGVLLVLVPSFGEYVIPTLLGGSKNMMVGSLISHYFLVARDSSLGSTFTLMSGLILLIVALLFHWYIYVTFEKMGKEDER